MRERTFGRLAWPVGEVGYGMWGMGGWTGSDDGESLASLQLAVDSGVTFFDTAWDYGEGRSERLLGEIVRSNPGRRLYTATKVPPQDRRWPPRLGARVSDVFPAEHVRAFAEASLTNLGGTSIDLLQFHAWDDSWAEDDTWQRVVDDIRREGLATGVGISVNRWQPWNVLNTLRTGLIDSVQVIYNVFEQAPEDELFPLCRDLGVAVIARVPFEEGALAGLLRPDSTWPVDDYRAGYFANGNLEATLERVEAIRPLVPVDESFASVALRFILSSPDVATVIPGMRSARNVRANLAASEAGSLGPELMSELRQHRWDRTLPTE